MKRYCIFCKAKFNNINQFKEHLIFSHEKRILFLLKLIINTQYNKLIKNDILIKIINKKEKRDL